MLTKSLYSPPPLTRSPAHPKHQNQGERTRWVLSNSPPRNIKFKSRPVYSPQDLEIERYRQGVHQVRKPFDPGACLPPAFIGFGFPRAKKGFRLIKGRGEGWKKGWGLEKGAGATGLAEWSGARLHSTTAYYQARQLRMETRQESHGGV
jgi:hypothetical protein